MEVRAVAKMMRVQPRKVRRMARELRGMSAQRSVEVLRFHPSKSASVLRKVIMSAMANAQENHGANPDNLRISEIQVGEGPTIKRIKARAQGRANRILKRTSHVMVKVEEVEPKSKVKPHGTKAKPRPTFGKPKGKKKDEPKTEETVAETAAVVEETADAQTEEVTTEETTEATVEETEAKDESEEGGEEPTTE